MTGNTFTELLKTYFKVKRKEEEKHENPPVVSEAVPALDPVVDAIANCNWRSMGDFTSMAFSNAVEQQKTLTMLSDELLRSVMMTASLEENNAKLKEEIAKTVEKKEEKEEKEEKKDLWAQLIDIAEDPAKEENKHD